MGTIFKIALRNLTQHKTKTLIIGLLIVLATFLSFLGNSILGSASHSMKTVFTQQFTGDVMVVPEKLQGGIFGGAQEDVNGPPILPTMPDFQKVYDLVSAHPEVEKITSQLSTYALFNLGDDITFGLLFGIEPTSYWSTFDAVRMVSGRKIEAGETGVIMLHEKIVKMIADQTDRQLAVGDVFQLNNFGETGFKVREVKVVGIFRFENANDRSFEFMNPGFVDVQTLRALTGKAVTTAADLKLKADTQTLLNNSNDDFFADAGPVAVQSAQGVDLEDLTKAVADKSAQADAASAREGTWNFQMVKLKAGTDDEAFAAALNTELKKAGLPAKAQTWAASASPDSQFFELIILALNLFIVLLAIVSVFVIMNTLVVSVMERTSEIGTMRAVGAQKGLIRRMFIVETVLVTALSGAVGIGLGFVGLAVVHLTGIPGPGGWMQSAFPGGVLHPEFNAAALPFTLVILAVIASISWIFPVAMATKVSPLKAINAD
jgi:ABC-type lipoprotein release transport system permease subunit